MRALLARLPRSADVSVGLLLFLVVLLMILPMPTFLVDGLIGLNFGVAILLLMTGVYVTGPLSLSSLPGIILISTVFRLSLSVTTTRLILAEGNAGAIVDTFGSIVVAGNVIVGLVVFLIITIVQFVVVSKGAERIAEVGARFTLDALPGKQMAIDAELRNGDIDNEQAREKRLLLERESQFYGSMDGAMKFVKGDAIAGLIIIIVNMVGGLMIGMAQFDLTFGDALLKYTLLTVGDALITQIPALLMSITAAIIVTRVKSDKQLNVGADISAQILSDPRAISLAAFAVFVMGILPGFPTTILLSISASFVVLAYFVALRRGREADEAAEAEALDMSPDAGGRGAEHIVDPESAIGDAALSHVIFEMAPDLMGAFALDERRRIVTDISDRVQQETGLTCCSIAIRENKGAEAATYKLVIDHATYLWASVKLGAVFVNHGEEALRIHEIPFDVTRASPWKTRFVIEHGHQEALRDTGLTVLSALDVVIEDLGDALVRNYGRCVGIQETKEILTLVEERSPMLVGEVLRGIPIQTVTEVFRRLLDERVSLDNMRTILETLVAWTGKEDNPLALVEYCRVALRQQICERFANARRVLPAIVLERDTEESLRENIRETAMGSFLVLNENVSSSLVTALRKQMDNLENSRRQPVLMSSMDIRRHLKTFLNRNAMDLAVMSFQEVSDDFTIVPTNTLRYNARKKSIALTQSSQGKPETVTPAPVPQSVV